MPEQHDTGPHAPVEWRPFSTAFLMAASYNKMEVSKMRSRFALSFFLVLAAGTAFAQDIVSEEGKLAYTLGWSWGSEIKSRNLDAESVISAIRDMNADSTPKLAEEEMQQIMLAFQQKLIEEGVEARRVAAQENQARSEAFLEENRGKTNIQTLPSGLQYRIIDEGNGDHPTLTSTVRMHYRISRMDEIEVASTWQSGVPQELPINQAPMDGWKEVLPLMTVGSTWQVFIPPELAFGPQGNGQAIGPNEVVISTLKLIEILPN
jgi:FKBP-type peptidyl-prolyl cis-trans isomerase FklB